MTEKIKKDMIDGNIVNSIVSSQVDLSDPENPILPDFVLKSVYDLAMINKADINGINTIGGSWKIDTISSDLFSGSFKRVLRVIGGQMTIEYGDINLATHRFLANDINALKLKVGSAEYTVFHTGNFNPDSKANTDGSNASGALAATIGNNHNHTNKSVLDSITPQDLIDWDTASAQSHNALTLGANTAGIDLNTATQRLQFQNGYQLPTAIKLGEYDEAFLMRHSHSNKLVLDNLTQTVIDNSHTHGNKALLDSYNQINADIAAAVSLRHSHINKAILDAITAAYTTADKNTLDALAGIQLEADQANALIRIKDGNGVVLSTLNVAFLNNEGTQFVYNPSNNTLDLINDYDQTLSSIPVSSFVTNLVSNANWNGTTPSRLDFKDNAGTILFSIDYAIANIQGLQSALNLKANQSGNYPSLNVGQSNDTFNWGVGYTNTFGGVSGVIGIDYFYGYNSSTGNGHILTKTDFQNALGINTALALNLQQVATNGNTTNQSLTIGSTLSMIGGNGSGIYIAPNQGGGASITYNANGNLDITPRSGYDTDFTSGNINTTLYGSANLWYQGYLNSQTAINLTWDQVLSNSADATNKTPIFYGISPNKAIFRSRGTTGDNYISFQDVNGGEAAYQGFGSSSNEDYTFLLRNNGSNKFQWYIDDFIMFMDANKVDIWKPLYVNAQIDTLAHGNSAQWYQGYLNSQNAIIGTNNVTVATNFNFAIGYDGIENFIQSHGGKDLNINPLGNTVKIQGEIISAGLIQLWNSYNAILANKANTSGFYSLLDTGFWNGQKYLGTTGGDIEYFMTYDNINSLWRPSTIAEAKNILGVKNSIILNSQAGLNNASGTGSNNGFVNTVWFDYNWANQGYAGSTISFGGFGGGYQTEIFGTYGNGGNRLGFRTRNDDINQWNPARWIWHDGNFDPDSKANVFGSNLQNIPNWQSVLGITGLGTNKANIDGTNLTNIPNWQNVLGVGAWNLYDGSAPAVNPLYSMLFDNNTGKWTYSTKGQFKDWLDLSAYALTSQIPTDNNQLTNGAGYITASALNGYATQTWVQSQGYLSSFTETDPTVPTHVKNITTGNISTWNSKQDALTAGSNISIVGNVISATGSGSGGIVNISTDNSQQPGPTSSQVPIYFASHESYGRPEADNTDDEVGNATMKVTSGDYIRFHSSFDSTHYDTPSAGSTYALDIDGLRRHIYNIIFQGGGAGGTVQFGRGIYEGDQINITVSRGQQINLQPQGTSIISSFGNEVQTHANLIWSTKADSWLLVGYD
ncbi:hypothetical protein [Paenimyroides baculatum]|uniref:Uncharacterized protein n=1 Tax=Paenimyroides baculatum TaxID=2608000 RepID=A0A5M6CI87_9FLAO|nr:hypothetical protein [Paenimyroides baculatum]KAA5532809.1 hypothetical protein F0460_13270 [Paenimyroides baculatum]